MKKMLLAVSDQHPWASESKIAMNTLKGQEMLMLDDGHCLRNQALDYCFTAGAKEDSHFQATSLKRCVIWWQLMQASPLCQNLLY